jgi:hypothetical protein
MPLSLFDHKKLVHYRSTDGQPGAFDHSFGGDAASYGLKFVNANPPFHLIYRLDLNDPAVPVRLDDTDFLQLIYGFHYATYEGTFVYRLRSAMEIEILAPTQLRYDADSPTRVIHRSSRAVLSLLTKSPTIARSLKTPSLFRRFLALMGSPPWN